MITTKANKKRQFYKYLSAILIVGAGLVFIFLVFLGYQQDMDNTVSMAEETLDFLKGSCRRYDNSHLSIESEAMHNLTDKAQIVRDYMDQEIIKDRRELTRFINTQNLQGILITDQNLKKAAQADMNQKNSENLWKQFLKNENKKNIIQNPNKIFSTKIKIKKVDYYVVIMARKAQKGLILCYQRADELPTDHYSYSFSEILDNNTFHGNPNLVITDDQEILATNTKYLKKLKKVANVPLKNPQWKEHQLTKIKFHGKTLYGMRQVYGKYRIYVCYETSEMFADLVPVVTVGVAVYIFFFMCMILIRQNMKQQNIMQQARQLQTIKAISSLYVSTALLDLDTKKCTPIKYSKRLKEVLGSQTDGDVMINALTHTLIKEEHKKPFYEFINIKNIRERMHQKKETFLYIYQDVKGIWYLTYIVPAQFKEDGEVKSVLIATRDINEHQTKEKTYQEELKKTAEDAKLANAAKTTFLRRMSHDIRTPINGIRGMATLAKHHLEEPGKEAEYIEKIITSSDYLLDLVNDVLQMNKLESGKIYLEHKSFNMGNLIKETVELCKMQADGQDIKLSLKEFQADHSYLIGSPLHLKQIAQNLITNAIKYNHAGGTVDITWKEIGFDGEKAAYQFICADTGNGMSEEFQKHLYEPFAQENDSGRSTYLGTGLGLPIVKQLIEYMGGSIEFVSEKGVGTTFTVTMTFEVAKDDKRQTEEIQIEDISINDVKILLVEDNEINMQIARELLEANGAMITEAHNGEEAVKIFEASKEGTFDVILMDIMMPVMNGIDATRYIRALKRQDAKDIPIFAMTANAFIEDKENSIEAGMNEHFSKPLNMEEVIKAICRYKKK